MPHLQSRIGEVLPRVAASGTPQLERIWFILDRLLAFTLQPQQPTSFSPFRPAFLHLSALSAVRPDEGDFIAHESTSSLVFSCGVKAAFLLFFLHRCESMLGGRVGL